MSDQDNYGGIKTTYPDTSKVSGQGAVSSWQPQRGRINEYRNRD